MRMWSKALSECLNVPKRYGLSQAHLLQAENHLLHRRKVLEAHLVHPEVLRHRNQVDLNQAPLRLKKNLKKYLTLLRLLSIE